MKMIGIAELKSKLSEYVTQVRAGEEILITDRGTPVAKLVRVESGPDELAELVRDGIVKPGSGKLPESFFSDPRPKTSGPTVSEALLEERRSGR